MRFRLVEDVNRTLGSYGDDWQDLAATFEESKLSEVIMKSYLGISNPKNNRELKTLIDDSIDTYSIDPSKNKFLSYLLTLKNIRKLSENDWNGFITDNLAVLNTRALAGDELKKEWYYDMGALNRPYKEFTYIINIADVLSDDSKRGKYFNNLEETTVGKIYEDGKVDINDKIKEPGLGSNNLDTIFGMINDWTKKYGVESKDDVSDEKYSIKDVLDYIMPEDTKKYTSQTDYLTKGLTKLLGDDGKLKNFNDMQMQAYRQSLATRDKDRQIAYINEKVLPRKTLQALADYLVKKSRSVR